MVAPSADATTNTNGEKEVSKERPILFSGSMVRAILEGRKTQTRRVLKCQQLEFAGAGGRNSNEWNDPAMWGYECENGEWVMLKPTGKENHQLPCPYGVPGDKEWRTGSPSVAGMYYVRNLLDESLGGDSRAVWVNPRYFTWGFSESDDPEAIGLDCNITAENIQWKRPGDRLWVRETWNVFHLNWDGYHGGWEGGDPFKEIPKERPSTKHAVVYAADGDSEDPMRPSIHMPRWASRITLEVKAVRVERLQQISEADAVAEGVGSIGQAYIKSEEFGRTMPGAVYQFAKLWQSINGPESWEANPWVWVVEFERMPNATNPA